MSPAAPESRRDTLTVSVPLLVCPVCAEDITAVVTAWEPAAPVTADQLSSGITLNPARLIVRHECPPATQGVRP